MYRTAFLLLTTALWAAPPVEFNRDIRPIMADTCFRCHGPDKTSRMAGLRLDIRDEALKTTRSGVVPIVPGDVEKSAIVQRIFATDAKLMPPKHAHKDLTAAQKETIKRWVAEGAAYQGHWAYQKVTRATPPASASHPVDAFIRDRLAREGLKAAPQADKRTLLRRVSLDLTGLPPTPEELDAFLKDASPEAYAKVVDRLLASPRYAEMQTMRWLDAVRYGDSAGFHGDNLWPVWPYRDYVLRAFRDNKPFDEFTREQLGGDLIQDATVDQKVASAYNRLNRASAEGGLQPKEYIAKYGADRVRTTTTVWLGSTLGCAECHDHKFDPFTAKDFYSMKAFFDDIRETGLIPDRGVRAWGSKLLLPTPEQSARLKQLAAEIKTLRAALDERAEALREQRVVWEEQILSAFRSGDLAWRYQLPIAAGSANGATLTVYNDQPVESNFYLNGSLVTETKRGGGLVVASGQNPNTETYSVQIKPGKGVWTALGIDVFQDESLPGSRVSRGADRFVLSEVEAELDGKKLEFVLATSNGTGEAQENGPMMAIDADPMTGWGVAFGEATNPFLALRFKSRIETSGDSVVTVRLRHESPLRRATIGRFRLALSGAAHSWPELGDSARKRLAVKGDESTLNTAVDLGLSASVRQALEIEEPERAEFHNAVLLQHFIWSSTDLQPDFVKLEKLTAERNRLEASIPRVLQTERMRPRVTRLLPRGNWMDETGEVVQPAIPGFLGKLDVGDRRATRLDLANWIGSTDNPLTARVFVNRTWRQLFGNGFSKVLEDVGSQGDLPSHLELLDWLAAEFMKPEWNAESAHGWDVKHIVRTIVTSETYKQSSQGSADAERRDPENRLLARQSRFRVDAEVVHDIALAAAGLLVEKFGGPSVRPYQPAGYLAAMNFPKREYSESNGDDLHRRALYTEWQRMFLHPSLLAFDAPTREECAVNRTSSNTPLQALVLLNDPLFVEAARVFAQSILASGKQLEGQIAWAFRRALQRAPTKQEVKILVDLHGRNLARFQAGEADALRLIAVGETARPEQAKPAELAAMATVARAILNLHETITRN